MNIFRIVPFLLLPVVPTVLYAQQSGGSSSSSSSPTTSSISTDFGDSYGGVENVAATSAGTFVGRPITDFVGTTDFYGGSSNSTRTANTTRRTSTRTTAARSATTTARRATTTTARTSTTGANNQTIQSITSIDFDFVVPPQRLQAAEIGAQLDRAGIRDSQITFTSSPMGTTAVLTGTVATDGERRVAQQRLLLEPGINRVENRLEVR